MWVCKILISSLKVIISLVLKMLYLTRMDFYSAFQVGKQVGGSHPVKNIMTMRRPLELLHVDLFDPNAYRSLGGNLFGLVIVDDFSRFTWVFFLDDKSQVQKIFKNFARKAQNQFDVNIKKV